MRGEGEVLARSRPAGAADRRPSTAPLWSWIIRSLALDVHDFVARSSSRPARAPGSRAVTLDLELLQVVRIDDLGLGEEVDPAGQGPEHHLEALVLDRLSKDGLHPVEDGVRTPPREWKRKGMLRTIRRVVDLGQAHVREDAALDASPGASCGSCPARSPAMPPG
ncbi:MAG: hypothetical protein MZV64_11350 [Ignavibacteriales bacterium]|nr:hypothetical protein [Ignavibacteriales bacterium]